MSIITKEIRAAWDRFRFWAFPISVRRWNLDKPGNRVYRYPAPGSEPDNHEFNEMDYKTAYRDSYHNIRYNTDLHKNLGSQVFMSDPLGETVSEKLVRYGYLRHEDIKSEQKVADAKKKFEQELGESPDVRVHHDDFGVVDQLNFKGNQEAIAEYVNTMFDQVRQGSLNESWLNDLDEVYRAQFYHLKTFDMAADDPMFRQLQIDIEGQLEDIANHREELKNFPVYKGDPSYWRIIDDSNSEENIRKVQSAVRNYAGPKVKIEDFTPVKVHEGEIPPLREIPTVRIPSKSQFVK